ncbi:MAG: ribbon-helix-helix domain-containing protein [Candidatus Methanofastidiosia archaeon]
MMPEKKFTTVSIPSPLFKKIEERIKETGFTSVSSYVTYVLREIIAESDEGKEEREPFTKEDEEKVKDRLRALGYLD